MGFQLGINQKRLHNLFSSQLSANFSGYNSNLGWWWLCLILFSEVTGTLMLAPIHSLQGELRSTRCIHLFYETKRKFYSWYIWSIAFDNVKKQIGSILPIVLSGLCHLIWVHGPIYLGIYENIIGRALGDGPPETYWGRKKKKAKIHTNDYHRRLDNNTASKQGVERGTTQSKHGGVLGTTWRQCNINLPPQQHMRSTSNKWRSTKTTLLPHQWQAQVT